MLDYIKSAAEVQAEAVAAYKRRVTRAIDRHVEDQARALRYNSAAHLAGYTTSTVTEWQAEAQAFVAWRDACWMAALDMLAAAQQGGPVPTVAEAIAALPEWSDS